MHHNRTNFSYSRKILQGNRVKELFGDQICEEVVVPCGDLSSEAHGVLAWRISDEVVGHMLDGGEVGWRMLGSDAAFIVSKDHVQDPMQAVLDAQWLRTIGPTRFASKTSDVM
jgi:hypothetical protein